MKRVLFGCENLNMATHLRRVHEAIKDHPQVRCFLTIPRKAVRRNPEEARCVRERLPATFLNEFQAHFLPWDLVILSDHGYFLALMNSEHQPVIHVPHGSPSKTRDGDELPWEYGSRAFHPDGRCKYTIFLEASERTKKLVTAARPGVGERIRVVGNTQDDHVLAKRADREEIRGRLGFGPDDVVVFIVSTWGESSLFREMGDRLLEAALPLQDRYRFVIRTHPNEYSHPDANGRKWGPYLEGFGERGFLVRRPADDLAEDLNACDVIVADHTTVVQKAVLLEKPAVFVPFEPSLVWADGATARYRSLSPILHEPERLEEALHAALHDYPMEKLRELIPDINSFPGESAERIRVEILSLLGLLS